MTENPYASPTVSTANPVEANDQAPGRIRILSAPQILNGVPLFFSAMTMLANREAMAAPMGPLY